MDLKLKNIKIIEALSEETTMFYADLYVGKLKVGYCKNDGHGGSTYYNAYPNQHELLVQAEQYCETLPDIDYGVFMVKSNLENWIDIQVENKVEQIELNKFKKKLEKDCLKGICFGDEKVYSCLSWKNTTIEKMLQYPSGVNLIKIELTRLIKEGKTILNKNIPSEIWDIQE